MAKLTTLKDRNDNTLYPLTKTNAVSDSNGTSLDSLLSTLTQNDSSMQSQIDGITQHTHLQTTSNTTYVDTSAGGGIWYFRIGDVVFVQVINITFKNVNQPHGAVIASGLPKPKGAFYINMTCWGGTHTTVRYGITENGELFNYWSAFTPTTSQKWSAYFQYLTSDD